MQDLDGVTPPGASPAQRAVHGLAVYARPSEVDLQSSLVSLEQDLRSAHGDRFIRLHQADGLLEIASRRERHVILLSNVPVDRAGWKAVRTAVTGAHLVILCAVGDAIRFLGNMAKTVDSLGARPARHPFLKDGHGLYIIEREGLGVLRLTPLMASDIFSHSRPSKSESSPLTSSWKWVPVVREGVAKDLPLPSYGTAGAAGLDLLAAISKPMNVKPGARALVSTGLRIALPAGYELQIRPRSGLALKHGITVLNTPGTIDEDYRGSIGVILINHGEDTFTVDPGMRIAQGVLARVEHILWDERQELPETHRGLRGFGSTGV